MSSTTDLIAALKAELRQAGVTYAGLARQLGLAESSVKRMFARADMPLTRIDAICRVLHLDFADLARRVVEHQPELIELTAEQEHAVVADERLLLVAICALSHWTFEQMVAHYRLGEAECTALLVQLDHLGILELRPLNRYRLRIAKGFRWRPNGPVMTYFREHALLEYFGGPFAGEDECLLFVHGSITRADAPLFVERMQKLAADFSQQHLADQKVAARDREGYTLLLTMRAWEFSAFARLQRPRRPPSPDHRAGPPQSPAKPSRAAP